MQNQIIPKSTFTTWHKSKHNPAHTALNRIAEDHNPVDLKGLFVSMSGELAYLSYNALGVPTIETTVIDQNGTSNTYNNILTEVMLNSITSGIPQRHVGVITNFSNSTEQYYTHRNGHIESFFEKPVCSLTSSIEHC